MIFAQGDAADAVFYLERGQVKLAVLSKGGRSGVVGILGPGDFFGEGCLAGQPVRMASALAMTDVSRVRIARVLLLLARLGKEGTTEPVVP